MSNTILTNDIIVKLTLKNLVNTLGTAKAASRNYSSQFVKGVGSSIRVGIPVRVTGRTTNAIVTYEDTVETEVDLVINKQAGSDAVFTQVELSRDVTDFDENYIKPRAIKIANLVNMGVIQAANLGFSETVGSAASTISGFNPISNLQTRMMEMSIEDTEYYCGLSPQSMAGVSQGNVSLFTPNTNERIIMRNSVGKYAGFQCYTDQSMYLHTTGTFGGTPLVNGASQTGTTLNLDGFPNSTAGVLKAGDIITIAGVYAINKETFAQLPYLRQFTVQADVTSNGSGQAAVTISPAITTTGPYKNVSAGPADNAAVSCFGIVTPGTAVSYVKNFGFTRSGLTLAAPPQVPNPGAVYSKNMTDPETGISIGMNIGYDIDNNQNKYRWDVYYATLAFNDYGANLASLY